MKVMVVDDNAIVRLGLRSVLSRMTSAASLPRTRPPLRQVSMAPATSLMPS